MKNDLDKNKENMMQKELTEGQTTNQLSTNNQINRHNKAKQQINNINMEKFAWRKCRKIFLEAIFSPKKKSFQIKFSSSFYAVSLA